LQPALLLSLLAQSTFSIEVRPTDQRWTWECRTRTRNRNGPGESHL